MKAFKYMFIIGNFAGLILAGIAIWRFIKTLKEHRKTSNDEFLSESEKMIQKKSIKILIAGILVVCITNLIQLVLIFFYDRELL